LGIVRLMSLSTCWHPPWCKMPTMDLIQIRSRKAIMDGKEKLKYWTHCTSSYYFRLSCMSWIGSWRKK
jgi:hypothetical protein